MPRELSGIDLGLFRERIPMYNKILGKAPKEELEKVIYFDKKPMENEKQAVTHRFWFKHTNSGHSDIPSLVFASKLEALEYLDACKAKIEKEEIKGQPPIHFPVKLYEQLRNQIQASSLPEA